MSRTHRTAPEACLILSVSLALGCSVQATPHDDPPIIIINSPAPSPRDAGHAGTKHDATGNSEPEPKSETTTDTESSEPAPDSGGQSLQNANGLDGGSESMHTADDARAPAPVEPDQAEPEMPSMSFTDAGAEGSALTEASCGADCSEDPASNTTLPDSSAAQVASLMDGIALLLPMDEEAWSGMPDEVVDYSGHENHGIAVGGATTTVDGKFGRAALLNGDNWIQVSDNASLRPDSAVTVSAWIYPTLIGNVDSHGIVVKRQGYSEATSYSLYLSPEGKLKCDIQMEESRFESVGVMETYHWYHVAIVFDGTQPEAERVRMFIDGELDRTAPEPSTQISPDFTADVLIGNLQNGGNRFTGRIDEVAVWSRALSDAEIHTLANATQSLATSN